MNINNGSVIINTDTAADAANSQAANHLGGLTLNAGRLILTNTVCDATALNGVAAATVRPGFPS